jgi:hypothetical protein
MKPENLASFHARLVSRGRGAKDWANTFTEVEYLGGGKFAASISVGHRVFRDKDGQWKKHKLTDERPAKGYVLVQGARCCVEVYPWYAKYYDVQHEEVRLNEERWIVQRLFKAPDDWRDVGAYDPVMTVEETENSIVVTVSYTTDYGPLVVKYIQRDEADLKHDIAFKNASGSTETFRVLQRWAGIVGSRCNGQDIPLNVDEPELRFYATKPEFNIAENLWGMVFNPDGSEKTDQCLQRPVKVEAHAQGMKADFVYGNWILAQGEGLEIDPLTATFQPPSLDGYILYRDGAYDSVDTTAAFLRYGKNIGSYFWNRAFLRFDVTSIPDDANNIVATFSVYHYLKVDSGTPKGDIELAEVADIGATLEAADWSAAVSVDYGTIIALEDEANYGWKSADVTASITPTDTYVSFRLKGSIEDTDADGWRGTCYSAQYATDTSLRPKLVVEYTTPSAAGGLKMIPSLKGHMGYDLKTRAGKARRRMF